MKVAVVGKGGAGKSMIAGTMARLLAGGEQRVLALDSDPMPGLSFSLGWARRHPAAADRQGGGFSESYTRALYAFHQVVHRLPDTGAFADWAIVGDLPAGPRPVAHDWAPYADSYVVVVSRSAVRAHGPRRGGGVQIAFVANRVEMVRTGWPSRGGSGPSTARPPSIIPPYAARFCTSRRIPRRPRPVSLAALVMIV